MPDHVSKQKGKLLSRYTIAQNCDENISNAIIRTEKLVALASLLDIFLHEITNSSHAISLNGPILTQMWDDVLPILDEHAQKTKGLTLAGISYEEMRSEVPRLFAQINTGAEQIRQTISALREFAGSSGSPTGQDLNVLIQDTLRLLKYRISRSALNLEMELADNLPRILGQKHHLEQLLIHLFNNACEGMRGQRGCLKVSTVTSTESNYVRLIVHDEGEGMDAKTLQHAKDLFFTTKKESGAMGMGLAIANAIALEHDGKLDLESEMGKGTTVTVAFRAFEENP